MKSLTEDEMQRYSKNLCEQGFTKEKIIIRDGKQFVTLNLTKKGVKYISQFIAAKPEMYLLIFLDIITYQNELNK